MACLSKELGSLGLPFWGCGWALGSRSYYSFTDIYLEREAVAMPGGTFCYLHWTTKWASEKFPIFEWIKYAQSLKSKKYQRVAKLCSARVDVNGSSTLHYHNYHSYHPDAFERSRRPMSDMISGLCLNGMGMGPSIPSIRVSNLAYLIGLDWRWGDSWRLMGCQTPCQHFSTKRLRFNCSPKQIAERAATKV